MLIKNYDGCSTQVCSGLDEQIIAELLVLSKGGVAKIKPRSGLICAPVVHPYLNAKAEASLGKLKYSQSMTINSAYRTIAQQAILYQNQGACGLVAAYPGKSNHQSGLAIDIEDSHYWKDALSNVGWNKLGDFDDMHFDYDGEDLRSLSVKAFQVLANKNNYSLTVDGDLGQTTLAALYAAPVEGFEHGLTPRVLKLTEPQQHGEDVKKFQTSIGLAKADGWYGKATEDAVKNIKA